jgi:hypothetical protein
MKRNIFYTLPSDLNSKILSIFSKPKDIAKVYRFIHSFRKISQKNKYGILGFMPLPATLIVKILNSNYSSLIRKLKENNILEVQSWWNGQRAIESYDKGRCRVYRINPTLINKTMVNIWYKDSSKYATVKHFRVNNRRCDKLIVENDLKSLIIDSRKLLDTTFDIINKINYKSFVSDDDITSDKFCVRNNYTGVESWVTHKGCMNYIRATGYTLIKDERHYFIDDFDRYIEMKKNNILWNYQSTINKLVKQSYYVGRNKVNRRLDHNLTATAKSLLKIILEDNNLIEIDLKNSQFAILAYLMCKDSRVNKTTDFDIFCRITKNGELYEYLQKEFGLVDRNEAKTMMMELAFSSHLYQSEQKRKLANLFPTVYNYIQNFKVTSTKKVGKGGHKQFAIWLQRTEAEIFVDYLYFQLKIKQGIFILTKHDSLIVKKENEFQVRCFMNEYFNSIGLNCTIN